MRKRLDKPMTGAEVMALCEEYTQLKEKLDGIECAVSAAHRAAVNLRISEIAVLLGLNEKIRKPPGGIRSSRAKLHGRTVA